MTQNSKKESQTQSIIENKPTSWLQEIKEYPFFIVLLLFGCSTMVWEFDLLSEENPLWVLIYGSMFFGMAWLLKETVTDFLNGETNILDLLKTIGLSIAIIYIILSEYFGIDLKQIFEL